MTELVSIITPVYNAARFLEETTASVLNQTYENFEWILVNDQSTDTSAELIAALQKQDDRIKLLNLTENSGAAVARNTGLKAAKGRYIAFIDSDDLWQPDKLERQLAFMQAHDYSFTFTQIAYLSEDGDTIKAGPPVPEMVGYHDLLKNTVIACSTVMIDRQQVGDFQMPLVRKGQDTATWLQLMRERGVKAHGLNQTLTYYRQVAGSISSNRLGALKRTWNTYRHLEKLPFFKATYYFCWYVFNAVRRRL